MKRRSLLPAAALVTLLGAAPALAVDHNNIDAGRPLSFDDADAIAFREQALELGLNLGWPRRRPLGLGLNAEYLYGLAPNTHVSLGIQPSVGGRADSDHHGFDFGNTSLGVFHNFNREFGNTPALSLRADAFLPTGRGARGVDFRLRGIASKQAGRYGRLHLNLDLNAATNAGRGERDLYPGLTLGFSHPLGYPRRFTTTGLAEVYVNGGSETGRGPVAGVGLGLRKQVGVRSVVDIGLEADLIGGGGAARDRVRLIAGYSYGF